MDVNSIRESVRRGEYIVSKRAEEGRRSSEISVGDLERTLLEGEIIKDYNGAEDHKGGRGCLILGFASGRAIHCLCGEDDDGRLIIAAVMASKVAGTEL
ncbi:MAG: DUF4258 domain-containing protein [bacterium]